jgi:hypothetical protein
VAAGTTKEPLNVPPGVLISAAFTVATVTVLKRIRMSVPLANDEPVT